MLLCSRTEILENSECFYALGHKYRSASMLSDRNIGRASVLSDRNIEYRECFYALGQKLMIHAVCMFVCMCVCVCVKSSS